MNIVNRIIISLALAILSLGRGEAQTVKRIELSAAEPYVDHVSLVDGAKDMDVLVKLMFDEPGNSLTVSLISYRKLFVFQTDTRYRTAVRCFKLKPDRLPYVAASDERARYRLTKSLRKSIRPRRKHVFKRWITYEGLQPRPTDYKLVNDYIEQRFDILNKEAPVRVTLRDLLVMNEEISPKKKKYELFFQTDLNRTYEITILRDPCFGQDETIAAAEERVETVRNSVEPFRRRFGHGAPLTASESQIFEEMKALLVEQFPPIEERDDCPEIQARVDLYNSYVDSLRQTNPPTRATDRQLIGLDLSAERVQALAREIDKQVGAWLSSDDPVERRDLRAACERLIEDVHARVAAAEWISASQEAALALFRKAERYFREICIEP